MAEPRSPSARSAPAGFRLLLLMGILCSVASLAQPSASFASLEITPLGDQSYDIATGLLVLDQGGVIVDATTGVTVTSAFIRIEEGILVEAMDSSAEGDFGQLHAEELRIDQAGGQLSARGIRLRRDALQVDAEGLLYFAQAQVVRLDGPVHGLHPDFQAQAVILDLISGGALLVGPYSFQDGPFLLRSTEGGDLLELVLVELEGSLAYDAASEVSPEVLNHLGAFLP